MLFLSSFKSRRGGHKDTTIQQINQPTKTSYQIRGNLSSNLDWLPWKTYRLGKRQPKVDGFLVIFPIVKSYFTLGGAKDGSCVKSKSDNQF